MNRSYAVLENLEDIDPDNYKEFEGPRPDCAEDEANLISSQVQHQPGWHMPTLDIDLPCMLVPSRTPGHFHLYIDKPMPWTQYRKLLEVLAEVGLIEPGYLWASLQHNATYVRKAALDAASTKDAA